MRKRYTGKQRAELVDLVRSGATVAEAARRLGVTPSSAYLWMKNPTTAGAGQSAGRSRAPSAPLLGEPTFVRVVPSDGIAGTITVRVGAAEIHVRRDFNAEFLRAVVEALGGGA